MGYIGIYGARKQSDNNMVHLPNMLTDYPVFWKMNTAVENVIRSLMTNPESEPESDVKEAEKGNYAIYIIDYTHFFLMIQYNIMIYQF